VGAAGNNTFTGETYIRGGSSVGRFDAHNGGLRPIGDSSSADSRQVIERPARRPETGPAPPAPTRQSPSTSSGGTLDRSGITARYPRCHRAVPMTHDPGPTRTLAGTNTGGQHAAPWSAKPGSAWTRLDEGRAGYVGATGHQHVPGATTVGGGSSVSGTILKAVSTRDRHGDRNTDLGARPTQARWSTPGRAGQLDKKVTAANGGDGVIASPGRQPQLKLTAHDHHRKRQRAAVGGRRSTPPTRASNLVCLRRPDEYRSRSL